MGVDLKDFRVFKVLSVSKGKGKGVMFNGAESFVSY